MSLSRHFYDLIEVQNALAYCLIERKPLEACFWLSELIDSDETSIALATMVEVYLVRYGCNRLVWLLEAHKAAKESFLDPDKLIELCYGLATMTADMVDVSLIASEIMYVHDAKSSIYPVPVKGTSIGSGLENFIKQALATDNIRSAFWAAHYCDAETLTKICNQYQASMTLPLATCFDAFHNLNTWSGLDYPSSTHVLMCFMLIALAHKPAAIIAKSFEALRRPTAFINEHIAEWDELIGRRARRLYSIPRDSLYLSTQRGIIPHTKNTLTQINWVGSNPSNTYALINECSYWRELFESHRNMVALSCTSSTGESHSCGGSDETWEAFCEWAFPDDIPDEWSAEEKAKSHGSGIINPGEPPLWRRYLRRYINTSYMSSDKASSINNNYSLLIDIISQIEVRIIGLWSVAKMLTELESLAYQKFVLVASTFDEEDLAPVVPVENEIIMMRQLDKLSL